jgi:hypothetical protein
MTGIATVRSGAFLTVSSTGSTAIKSGWSLSHTTVNFPGSGSGANDMSWSDPIRVRRSVQHGPTHLGYVTVVSYPNRDLTLLPQGSPYSEIVIADPAEEHVALLQRFKAHWLIRCGEHYGAANVVGDLTDAQSLALAVGVLSIQDRGEHLVKAIVAGLEWLVTRKPTAR